MMYVTAVLFLVEARIMQRKELARDSELECVPSVVKYKVQSDNTSRPRASKRKVEEDMLDPEEDAKRKMRRNRNRLAAAKCRQKRLDQISELQVEVTNWERRNRSLEEP